MSNITLIRYAVAGTIRPSITDTMRIGDMARTACMSLYGRRKNNQTSPTFSGKGDGGKPLTGHMHAFYLPTYETQNSRIDHLTIIAKNGFDNDELDVLFGLKRLYKYNMEEVHLVFEGCGATGDFTSIPILKESKVWNTATPMVLTRHLKYKKRENGTYCTNSPEKQIRNELKLRYGTSHELKNITVDTGHTNISNTSIKPMNFYRWRRHGSVGSDTAYKVHLEFKKPIRGPLSLGYGAHFGLGMFTPEEK